MHAARALLRHRAHRRVLGASRNRGGAACRRRPAPREKRRLNHLLEVQRSIALHRNRAYVGTDVEVLVEGVSNDGRPYGRSRENKVTWLPADSASPGTLVRARVTEASAWQLQAEATARAA